MGDYFMPFKVGMRVCEIGGGDQPLFRPNVDRRPMATVDIVADLNLAIPFPNQSWDGVYSKFVIEHLSWRRVRPFISELSRILVPGGIAVVITSNTREQCRLLAEKDLWEDSDVCMLFGDQNYQGPDWDSNAHHTGFSIEYADRLFREQGFFQANVFPTPWCSTDLIIEAQKSRAVILHKQKEVP